VNIPSGAGPLKLRFWRFDFEFVEVTIMYQLCICDIFAIDGAHQGATEQKGAAEQEEEEVEDC
jgi:hypothetical protein